MAVLLVLGVASLALTALVLVPRFSVAGARGSPHVPTPGANEVPGAEGRPDVVLLSPPAMPLEGDAAPEAATLVNTAATAAAASSAAGEVEAAPRYPGPALVHEKGGGKVERIAPGTVRRSQKQAARERLEEDTAEALATGESSPALEKAAQKEAIRAKRQERLKGQETGANPIVEKRPAKGKGKKRGPKKP